MSTDPEGYLYGQHFHWYPVENLSKMRRYLLAWSCCECGMREKKHLIYYAAREPEAKSLYCLCRFCVNLIEEFRRAWHPDAISIMGLETACNYVRAEVNVPLNDVIRETSIPVLVSAFYDQWGYKAK